MTAAPVPRVASIWNPGPQRQESRNPACFSARKIKKKTFEKNGNFENFENFDHLEKFSREFLDIFL